MAEHLKPIQWDDLSIEEQNEIVQGAKDRLFWKSFWSRFSKVKHFSAVVLSVLAVWAVFKEQLAHFLKGILQ